MKLKRESRFDQSSGVKTITKSHEKDDEYFPSKYEHFMQSSSKKNDSKLFRNVPINEVLHASLENLRVKQSKTHAMNSPVQKVLK